MAEGQDKGNNKREFEDNNSDSDSDSEVYSPAGFLTAQTFVPLLFATRAILVPPAVL